MKMTRAQLLVGFLVVVFCLLGFIGRRVYRARIVEPRTVSSAELHANWVQRTDEIRRAYESDRDAARARDALLALRVTREDQQAHLDLVLRYERLLDTAQARP